MFNLFAAFVSYIFRIYIRIILLDTSVRVCFRVCVHIICIHLCRWVIQGTDSSCSCRWSFRFTWVPLFVFFRMANVLRLSTHLCLSSILPFVQCEIISRAREKIYRSLMTSGSDSETRKIFKVAAATPSGVAILYVSAIHTRSHVEKKFLYTYVYVRTYYIIHAHIYM